MEQIVLYTPIAELINGLDRISSVISDYNFLFVTLDSSDFTYFKEFKEDLFDDMHLEPDAQKVYTISPEGMWVKGKDIQDLVLKKKFAPRFNALYIFDRSISRSPLPSYCDTSECIHFSTEQELPEELVKSLANLNASGYMSDGDGLNVVLFDQRLIRIWNSTDWSEGNPNAQ